MNREKALEIINQHVKNKNSIKHMLAVEAVMRALAKKFEEDEDKWGIAGLVHDVDMEEVDYNNNPELHGKRGVEILEKEGFSREVLDAVIAHNKETGKKRETLMEKSIFAADPVTGLIVASTLVLPDRKIDNLSVESVMKRFKEKAFARGADRETILSCSKIGLNLEEFISTALSAMKNIKEELEL